MIPVGRFSSLPVKALLPEGVVLGEGRHDVLLPARLAPAGLEIGQSLRVFVYTDSDDELTATTESPRAVVGEFALLEVVDVGEHGAFVDWGLGKDLFVPHSQQHSPMVRGRSYVVAVYLDQRTNRVAAASKLGAYFDYDVTVLEVGQPVELLVYGFSELGIQVVVDRRYSGLVYGSDTFKKVTLGEKMNGFIQTVRPDNKLDISLRRTGAAAAGDAVSVVLAALQERGGVLALTDKSPPERVYEELGISKKAFKAAIGQLYKARRVAFDDRETWLVTNGRPGQKSADSGG